MDGEKCPKVGPRSAWLCYLLEEPGNRQHEGDTGQVEKVNIQYIQ